MRVMPQRGRAYRYGCEQKQEDFKMHLDVYHFATIQQKNDHISVICTLCDQASNNLPEHKIHLTQKHPYLLKFGQIPPNHQRNKQFNLKKMLSVRQVKAKLRQIENSSHVVILRQIGQNKLKVKYQNRDYEGFKFEKEYNGMEYDQIQVYSELILAPIILGPLNQAKYFIIHKTPIQTTIKCQSLILCDHSLISK